MPSYMSCGRPPLTRQVSKLVPPTSAVIRLSIPSERASSPAPSAPATGPDMMVSNGRSSASAKVIEPPPERVMSSRPCEADLRELLVQPAQVVDHPRADEGIDHRGRGSLVLAVLARDPMGDRYLALEACGAELALGLDLVNRIGVGVHVGDGDGVDALALEHPEGLANVRGFLGDVDLAVGADPLLHGTAEPAGHQRRRRGPEQVVHFLAVAPADFQDVAEALGGQQSDHGAAALQKRVDADGGAVEEILRRLHAVGGHGLADGGDHALVGIVGRGRHLGDQRFTRDVVVVDEVGERPPDINTDSRRHCAPPLPGMDRMRPWPGCRSGARRLSCGPRSGNAAPPCSGLGAGMTETILEVEDLAKHYTVGKDVVRALAGVNLAVAPGESVAIVGESGSGKTTLAKLVLGVEEPSAGRIVFDGAELGVRRDRGSAPAHAGRAAEPAVYAQPQAHDQAGGRAAAPGARHGAVGRLCRIRGRAS